MRYHILAVDYDGTLATDSKVSPDIVKSLARVKATGRKLILVTGRQLEELLAIFPEYALFDRIVAENGALLYTPGTMELRLLGEKPPEELINLLTGKQIPVSVGHVVVATWEPHHEEALEAIRSIGLEYQLIFNKGAVMILPPGVNKSSGLLEALKELDVSARNTIVIGDAENDHAMLMTAEFSVAVSNALPLLKLMADWTTSRPCGEGVAELISHLIKDDLSTLGKTTRKHDLALGTVQDGSNFNLQPYGSRILLTGTSSCGKTTFAAALVEKLVRSGYQFCLIDPEGDYRDAEGVINVGDSVQVPLITQVMQLLKKPGENVNVCMLAVPLADRPSYFKALLAHITALHQHSGHPHFLIVDEAHHLIPKEHSGEVCHFFEEINGFLAITTSSNLLQENFLNYVNTAMIMGDLRREEMQLFIEQKKQEITEWPALGFGNVLVWQNDNPSVQAIKAIMPERILRRHKRKYASGDMGYNSFYFTGPGHRLNLKAQNLLLFIQIGEGVDDDTWLYHLHRSDYSNWFRNSVKNTELADSSKTIEKNEHDAKRSRKAIFALINEQYTAPA